MPQREEILRTFTMFCQPYEDKVGGPKLDVMHEFFAELPKEWIPGIGLIVNKQDNPRKVVVSHMDLIGKFKKGFAENKTFEIVGDEVIGALDNTITNAVLANIILEMSNEGTLDGIEFLFSEGEEVGMVGMSNYLKEHKDRVKSAFFINLDVTNEGYHKHISLEYDKPSFNVIKHFQNLLGEHAFFTGDRVCDDTDAIVHADCHGLSVCLPTDNVIHSYKNKCRIESISIYKECLKTLIVDQSFEYCDLVCDISARQVDDALKHDKKEDLPEIPKYNRRNYLFDDWEDSWNNSHTHDEFEHLSSPWDDNVGNDHFVDKDIDNSAKIEDITSFIINEINSFHGLSIESKANFMSLIEVSLMTNEFSSDMMDNYLVKSDRKKMFKMLKDKYDFKKIGKCIVLAEEAEDDLDEIIFNEFLYSEWFLRFDELNSINHEMQERDTQYYQLLIRFFYLKFYNGDSTMSFDDFHLFHVFDMKLQWIKEAQEDGLIDFVDSSTFKINFF